MLDSVIEILQHCPAFPLSGTRAYAHTDMRDKQPQGMKQHAPHHSSLSFFISSTTCSTHNRKNFMILLSLDLSSCCLAQFYHIPITTAWHQPGNQDTTRRRLLHNPYVANVADQGPTRLHVLHNLPQHGCLRHSF